MSLTVFTKTYTEPAFCEKEILRYAACKNADSEIKALLKECVDKAREVLTYRVCYCILDVKINGSVCDFGAFCLQSENLAQNLKGCRQVILFAATVGVGIDRLIAKYTRLSPAKAIMFEAIGAERVEALCDTFCKDISEEINIALVPRFSPGYGDLPLSAQVDIFAVLAPQKHIGLTLNGSLLMSPSKSVTAFAGIGAEKRPTPNKCGICENKDCLFRGA